MDKITIVTLSYAPDFERCKRLCQSIDRHVGEGFEHLLIVDGADLPLFSSLESPRRRLMSVEQVLPKSYRKLPFSKRWWLGPGLRPVRGWIVQQLAKLSTAMHCASDVLVFIDSDVQFFRALETDAFADEGRTLLFTEYCQPPSDEHQVWQRRAETLLGLEQEPFQQDYIGNLIAWRRDNVLAMLKLIEERAGKRWDIVLGRQLTFSEYILYGNYANRVLKEKSNHAEQTERLCIEIWNPKDLSDALASKLPISQSAISVLIQSNLKLPPDKEAELFAKILGGFDSGPGETA